MNKRVLLLSYEDFTDEERLVTLAIDGLIIEGVSVIANTEEKAILKNNLGHALLMSLWFDAHILTRIQRPLLEAVPDRVIGRVERIVLRDEIEINCGVVITVYTYGSKDFPKDIKPGDYLSFDGIFFARIIEE